jgi:ATP-dependent DNA helicase RecQ
MGATMPDSTPSAASSPRIKDPLAALETYFGHRKFLDGQSQIVAALVGGRDTMAILPTGGGKSLCYQLPAMIMDGVTLVVSPLIALMKDQVDALTRKGIPATVINSTLTPSEQQDRIRRMREGEFKLVYVAPERFRSRSFIDALRQVTIGLFAVDEAHCLSQWGHDFRPDYMRLGQVLQALDHPQTAAFTATATPIVRDDILTTLGLRDPYVCISGFERPNLQLTIRQIAKKKEKYERLRQIVRKHKTGIVYCATRKMVEEVSETLHAWGSSTVAYHGGMDDAAREEAQNLFIKKKRDVAVATNAFGMGIDRADVRFVIHFQVPGSVEAYYQEAGRAGRDGEPSVCELLFNYADTRTQEFFIDGNNPALQLIADTYDVLRNHRDANDQTMLTIKEIAEKAMASNDMGVSSALSLLVRNGLIERFDVPGQRARGTRVLRPEITSENLPLDHDAILEKEKRDREKLNAMVALCYATECRQQWILRYFGEEDAAPCGNCDNCSSGTATVTRAPDADEQAIVRKALSGVARMSRRTRTGYEGRFGRAKIAMMLVGSRSQEVVNARLDELSTYGLLSDLGQAYVLNLLRALQDAGLLTTERGEFPLLALTPRGIEVMKGAKNYHLAWPDRGTVSPAGTAKASRKKAGRAAPDLDLEIEGLEFDEFLFEKLREKRAELAASEGNVPAYVIFSNQTLEFLTRLKPATVEAGQKIRGIGPAKAEKYLADFIQVIREYLGK